MEAGSNGSFVEMHIFSVIFLVVKSGRIFPLGKMYCLFKSYILEIIYSNSFVIGDNNKKSSNPTQILGQLNFSVNTCRNHIKFVCPT